MKIFFYSFLFVFLSFSTLAQQDSVAHQLSGQVIDKQTGEKLPFVNVLLEQNNSLQQGTSTDLDGKFSFNQLHSGKYTLKVNYVGYKSFEIKELSFTDTTFIKVELETGDLELEEFTVMKSANFSSRLYSVSGVVSRRKMRKRKGSSATSGRSGGTMAVKVNGTSRNLRNEGYDKIKENQFIKVKKEPLSTFSIDVDKASYSNVRRFINQGQLPPADAVRTEELINYFDYNYPQSTTEHPFSITTEYTTCPWNSENKLVSIAIQGDKIDLDEAPANNLVFLLDVSGSMNSYDKLELLKSGLGLLIDQLRKKDQVSIVVYAGAAGVVLKPTKGNQKEKIREALNDLQAGGSTAGGAGIELAYKIAKKYFIKNGNNRVILATDGDFNVGVSGDEELTKLIETKREEDIFLSVLGFGTGNYKDSKMEKIADKGNGNYAYIDNILEAKKVLVKEMGGTLLTIAKDVKLQIEFNPVHVKSYRLIGYENRRLENEDFDDDTKDAGELGSGHTVTALYEIVPANSTQEDKNDNNLKYQSVEYVANNTNLNEILTVKFRYKEPKGKKSKLISHIVYDKMIPFENASNNLKFASAVIEFSMLLRKSDYLGTATYESCINLAKSAKGTDQEGYRAEFIKLAETAELLEKSMAKETD